MKMAIDQIIKPEHRGLVCTVCGLASAVYLTPWRQVLVCDNNDCICDAMRENCDQLWNYENKT